MGTPSRPDGYPAVSAYLVVPSAQVVIDFAAKTFGAITLRRYDMPDGTVMRAEFRIDDSVVMVSDAGGVSVQAPLQKPGDPDKRGGARDPGGNTWWISTQIGD